MYPNQVRETKNQLKCWITDMDGNDVETVASINIRGTVIVPELRAVKSHVYLKECYLQFPYEGEFVVKNPTELPAMYCVILKVRHGTIH
ncbi:Hydrocephalus-inducing protein [Orchesella cincta]|uniref:Hydrocephalus-inducing protein n=1 Tax=Orchesella cincta TaxID=48709 RepID=A0A1D2MPM3_ORCCI|nr:Hydrocephalus-inducing protein [Orchesella cincta]